MRYTFKLSHTVHQTATAITTAMAHDNEELDIWLMCNEVPVASEEKREEIIQALDKHLFLIFGPDVKCLRCLMSDEQYDPSLSDEENAKIPDLYHIHFAFELNLTNSRHLQVK